jgi:hypothetical protein
MKKEWNGVGWDGTKGLYFGVDNLAFSVLESIGDTASFCTF